MKRINVMRAFGPVGRSHGLRAALAAVRAWVWILLLVPDAWSLGEPSAERYRTTQHIDHYRVGVPWYDEASSREWFVLGLGFIDRDDPDTDVIDDGVVWSLDGGYELWREPLAIALELGVTYSAHHVDMPDAETLDLWRFSMGARITWPRDDVRPYLRGGFFYRWNSDNEYEEEPFDQNGIGYYAGVGLDFPYHDGMTLGPFYTRYEGTDDDLSEQIFGLCAGFRF